LSASVDLLGADTGLHLVALATREVIVSATTSRISSVSLVCIPTNHQDDLVQFYVEKLSFDKRTDVPMGGEYRWVEVYPPNGTTGIALAPPPPGQQVDARDTGIILATDDIEAAHAQLASAGVDVDAEISRMGDPVPPMFWFRDPDGNTLIVVEQT